MRTRGIGWAAVAVAMGATLMAGVAGAATSAPQAPGATAEKGSLNYDAHASARPLVLRQVFAYGRQSTSALGVKIAHNGSGSFGKGTQLRARFGGWSCDAGWVNVPRRYGWVHVRLAGLMTTCDTSAAIVSEVRAYTAGSRLITDRGTLRIKQRWSKAPRSLKRQVHQRHVRYDDDYRTYLWIGRFQNPCKPARPLPVRSEDPNVPSPVQVAVGHDGRIGYIAVHTRIVEGITC